MSEKFLDLKYLIGDNFDVPMEIGESGEYKGFPIVHNKDGSITKISVGQFTRKMLGGGKAERVTQKEWDEALKKRRTKKSNL